MAMEEAKLDVRLLKIKFRNFYQLLLQIFEDLESSDLSGSLTVPSNTTSNKKQPGSDDFSSLDEPIKETFVSNKNVKMSWQFQKLFSSFFCSSETSVPLVKSLSMFSIQQTKIVYLKNGICGVH